MKRVLPAIVVSGSLLAVVCAVPSCQSAPTKAPAMSLLDQLTSGQWNLNSIMGEDAAGLLRGLPPEFKVPSLSFTNDGQVTGFGGVNRLSAKLDPASLAAGKLDFSKLISTKMAGPGPAMSLETRFTNTLQKVKSFSFGKDGTLDLSDGKQMLLSFVKGR